MSAINVASPIAVSDAHQAENKPLAVGDFQGKKVFHWSFYVQVVGALGGLIIAVAGVVLAMPYLIAPGILFLASNAIGAYYVHTFSVYSQLDTYVAELQEKLNAAQSDLNQQKTVNKQLNDLLKKTQEEFAKIEEAGKKNLSEWTAKEKQFKDQIDALNNATQNVEKERKEALDAFDKRFNELHSEYIVLETNKKAVEVQLVKLTTEATSFKDSNAELRKELEEFKTNYNKYDEENKELKTLNEQFSDQIKKLTEQLKAVPKLNTKPLEKELDETEKAADKASDKADALIKQMEELLKS